MREALTADDLRRELKRRGVHLNTLHALLRLGELDTRKRTYHKEREARILKFVAMLGGIREPDLVAISRLSQPTLWRLVEAWRTSGAIRVVTEYNDHVVGRRAKWLQPPESAELPDGRRAYLVETAARIKAYIPLWEGERAAAAQPAPPASPPLELPRRGNPAPVVPAPPPAVPARAPTPPPAMPSCTELPPAPIVVAPVVKAPPAAPPLPRPEPPPVVRVEPSPPAVLPVAEPIRAPAIRIHGPPITRLPVEPRDPWEPDDPYRSMFEVTEHMVRRQQRERRERRARMLDRLSALVAWLFIGTLVTAVGIVVVPLLIYLVTGWDLLLIISTVTRREG